jgi:hypothetical protein
MKLFTSVAALSLALAMTTPAFATSDKASGADKDAKTMQHDGSKMQKSGGADGSSAGSSGQRTAADETSGPVSDIPRNQTGCDEAGGKWDDSANVCKDAKM